MAWAPLQRGFCTGPCPRAFSRAQAGRGQASPFDSDLCCQGPLSHRLYTAVPDIYIVIHL
eukprot:1158120-Pelagomonas_calceolata.AAC.8